MWSVGEAEFAEGEVRDLYSWIDVIAAIPDSGHKTQKLLTWRRNAKRIPPDVTRHFFQRPRDGQEGAAQRVVDYVCVHRLVRLLAPDDATGEIAQRELAELGARVVVAAVNSRRAR